MPVAAYYQAHRERCLEVQKAYRARNLEQVVARDRRYYQSFSQEERNAKWGKWAKEDPARRAAYMAKRRALARAFVDAAMAGGCVDCGTKEQVVLDLDHVRGSKVSSIGLMLGGSLKKLFVEIDKCETRCANCHRRVTAQRRKAAA